MTQTYERNTFARRLKAVREERGMDQSALAAASGVSIGAIARYESERNTPNVQQIVKLANALNCSLDVLCGRVPLVVD